MKKLSKVILKLLKEKREDAEQKVLSMAPCFGKGFTLIELLVVVLIIGILSAVALPQYTMAVEKARATEAIQNASVLEKQLDLYILENGYPNGFIANEELGLSVEISGAFYNENSGIYETKFFSYGLLVGQDYAIVEIARLTGGDYYTLISHNKDFGNSNKVGNWYRTCITQLNDFGRKVCRQLESQGWAYSDTEV